MKMNNLFPMPVLCRDVSFWLLVRLFLVADLFCSLVRSYTRLNRWLFSVCVYAGVYVRMSVAFCHFRLLS